MSIEDRLQIVAELGVSVHSAEQHFLVRGLQLQSLGAACKTLLIVLELEVRHCQVVQHSRLVGIGLETLEVVLDGFGVVAILVVEVAAVLQAHIGISIEIT